MKIDITNFLDRDYKQKYIKELRNKITVNACNQYRKSVLIRRYWNLNEQLAYILGLWSGDKYIYGNRIGLSNKNSMLLKQFEKFLKYISNFERVQFVIENDEQTKVYISSSLLRRIMESIQRSINNLISKELIVPYLAGRIDSDGCILISNLKHNSGLAKITYDKLEELENDRKLLNLIGYKSCILKYKKRNAYDLKISVLSCMKLFPLLLKYIKNSGKKNNILFCIAARTIKLVP